MEHAEDTALHETNVSIKLCDAVMHILCEAQRVG